jgi:endonuclease G
MAVADLARTATLSTMERLAAPEQPSLLAGAPAIAGPPTTPAQTFKGRPGFNGAFLNGWPMPLPRATGKAAVDMRSLRRGGRGVELKYRNFSVIVSASRRLPMLTGVNINGLESRSVPRIDTWSLDGRLDPGDQWGDDLYSGNSLDRGHMVRREDPVWGTPDQADEANVDTFHFTNSCPQMAGVNQVTWLGLENYILKHARADAMRVNVFTGPYFSDRDLEYRGARIPLAFWKVVAIVTQDGRPSATAYQVSQSRELQDLQFVYAGYRTYQISVQQVIDHTNIDFRSLVAYDGFSHHERLTGEHLAELLPTLDAIRI